MLLIDIYTKYIGTLTHTGKHMFSIMASACQFVVWQKEMQMCIGKSKRTLLAAC